MTPIDSETQTQSTSLSDRPCQTEVFASDRHTETELISRIDQGSDCRPFTRTTDTETDPLWVAKRIICTEIETDVPDPYDPYFFLSGNLSDRVVGVEGMLRRAGSKGTNDTAFDGQLLTGVTDPVALRAELLRLESRLFVCRQENQMLRKLVSGNIEKEAGVPYLEFLDGVGVRSENAPQVHLQAPPTPAPLSPAPPSASLRIYRVVSPIEITSSKSPSSPVIGNINEGQTVVAFREAEDGRVPLKPRGWCWESSLRRVNHV